MKKFAVCAVLVFIGAALVGCSGAEPPSDAWADSETLTYSVYRAEKEIGTLTIKTVRSGANGSDGGCEIKSEVGDVRFETSIKLKNYNVVSVEKTFTDAANPNKNYTFKLSRDGKHCRCVLNGDKGKKVKIGNGNFTASDFIYNYIRCFPVDALPQGIKVIDPSSGRVSIVETALIGTELVDVPYPGGIKKIDCNVVKISLKDAPKGKAITARYVPAAPEYNLKNVSIMPSRKIPVLISENDVAYRLAKVETS